MKKDNFVPDGIIDEKTTARITEKMDEKQMESLKAQLKEIDTKKLLEVFSSLDPKEVKSKLKNLDLKSFDPEKLKSNTELYKKIKKD